MEVNTTRMEVNTNNLLKNCHVIYFKDTSGFSELIGDVVEKIIITDSQELRKTCMIKGILHIQNTDPNFIPNEKIDCIIVGKRNAELELSVIKSGLQIPILIFRGGSEGGKQSVWCGVCNKLYSCENTRPIGKYCSERCMGKSSGFIMTEGRGITLGNTFKTDVLNDLKNSVVLAFDKTLSDKKTVSTEKKTVDKFQSSVVKEAIRLEYAFKRESYKKEMRQPSLRKNTLSDKKQTVVEESTGTKYCKGITKKGKKCTNKVVGNSDYCGILSHACVGGAGGVNED